jgi:SAM-dependent methyltransferase
MSQFHITLSRALRLWLKALTFRVPIRALRYRLLNKINYLDQSGNHRYDFERRYLENPDPWNYNSSQYEIEKYRLTLEAVLKWGRNQRRALEVGCSVGVFTRMLAVQYDEVTAMDISREAIRIAARHPETTKNILFLREDLLTAQLPYTFDAIFCAEVLYYIKSANIPLVCGQIDKYLADDGILVMVTGCAELVVDSKDWNQVFQQYYDLLFSQKVQDEKRPYGVFIYARRGASKAARERSPLAPGAA